MVWRRLSRTGEALGVLCAVATRTVSRSTGPLLQLLRDRGQETLGWPEEARALVQAPEETGAPRPAGDGSASAPAPEQADSVALRDATAQRVERSQDHPTPKAPSSGKKKAPTRKTLLLGNAQGRLRSVSAAVPGAAHALTLLRPCGAREEVPPALALLADRGFQGLQNDVPARSVALP